MGLPSLVYVYGDRRVVAAGSGTDAVRCVKSLDTFAAEAEDKLGLAKGTYSFYDRYGKIEEPEDLQRALQLAGSGECTIEIREHSHIVRLRMVEDRQGSMGLRMSGVEAAFKDLETQLELKLQKAQEAAKQMVLRVEKRITEEVLPVLEALCHDRNKLLKDNVHIMEKLVQIDIKEMAEMQEKTAELREEMRRAVMRVQHFDTTWAGDRAKIHEDSSRLKQEMKELQRYMQGKIDVCIEADSDLRREQQLSIERMQLVADDLRLLTEDHQRLARQCTGALEESEELRTLLGQLREDNAHVRAECGQVHARVHCIEGTAAEQWQGFVPGVLYFRAWHRFAKGPDVQLSGDLSVATGRGFLAATGVVLGTDEGLAVADGPCRRWGTPGRFAAYYELEVEEVCQAPEGAGGLYVGVSLQSGEEMAAHPRREFDGWLVGGACKALVCRAGNSSLHKRDYPALPETVAPGGHVGMENPDDAVTMLRIALPPRSRGEVREIESIWGSQTLRRGDRVGVLFRCGRDGTARLRVAVNGQVVTTHDFIDAPPAEAVGFLTPVVRLAGTGKSVRLLPGLQPPSRLLAD